MEKCLLSKSTFEGLGHSTLVILILSRYIFPVNNFFSAALKITFKNEKKIYKYFSLFFSIFSF